MSNFLKNPFFTSLLKKIPSNPITIKAKEMNVKKSIDGGNSQHETSLEILTTSKEDIAMDI